MSIDVSFSWHDGYWVTVIGPGTVQNHQNLCTLYVLCYLKSPVLEHVKIVYLDNEFPVRKIPFHNTVTALSIYRAYVHRTCIAKLLYTRPNKEQQNKTT